MKTRSETFLTAREIDWEECGTGIRRQIMGYDPNLMVVKVRFDAGAVGARHSHPHAQTTCIVSGRFEANVGSQTRTLGPGDACYVDPDQPHGLRCLEEGIVLDIFAPARTDFLK
ncbi:cupin domain-containing protein [Alistipes sp.]|uniref:cupin domain-containing protein n=1 Tax=Alistipes sp. TaxID=1872444 RepID=UPI003AEFA37E